MRIQKMVQPEDEKKVMRSRERNGLEVDPGEGESKNIGFKVTNLMRVIRELAVGSFIKVSSDNNTGLLNVG